ncbi:MAG: hypothetical protein LBT05_07370 [Planctomycetaceae bacterium]|jgi:hypothetical protein|nr:hypothetical protein [Planctomycetaceae bacterium]
MVSETTLYFGFLTVAENSRCGLIGGYLVLNHAGRPVEFHCTSPVRANRAQEILYGATLEAFLYGEQIAQTLVNRAKTKPVVVLSDMPQVLAAQEFIEMPLVFIEPSSQDSSDLKNKFKIVSETPLPIDFSKKNDGENQKKSISEILASVSGINTSRWSEQKIGRYRLAAPELSAHSAAETVAALETVSHAIDLAEPFERICLAVEEAQRAA